MTWRVFECTPLRGGWVRGWVIDRHRVPQYPELRVEAGAQLVLRADADQVIAEFGYDPASEPRPSVAPLMLIPTGAKP